MIKVGLRIELEGLRGRMESVDLARERLDSEEEGAFSLVGSLRWRECRMVGGIGKWARSVKGDAKDYKLAI